MMITKKCKGCGELKAAEHYHADLRTGDGLGTKCKDCRGDGPGVVSEPPAATAPALPLIADPIPLPPPSEALAMTKPLNRQWDVEGDFRAEGIADPTALILALQKLAEGGSFSVRVKPKAKVFSPLAQLTN